MSERQTVDLSALAESVKRQTEGIEVEIVGLDGETPTGLKIRVAGPDSEKGQRAHQETTDWLISQQVDGKVRAVAAAERNITHIAKVTLGWSPEVITDGEEEFPFSQEAAARLYTKYRYVREQVEKAANNRLRFTKG